jgi:hypothetical protein
MVRKSHLRDIRFWQGRISVLRGVVESILQTRKAAAGEQPSSGPAQPERSNPIEHSDIVKTGHLLAGCLCFRSKLQIKAWHCEMGKLYSINHALKIFAKESIPTRVWLKLR